MAGSSVELGGRGAACLGGSLGAGRRSRTPLTDLDAKFVTKSGLCVSGDVGEGRGGGPRITHLTGSSSGVGVGVVEDEPRFPRLDQCAHFHYEYVELPPLQVSLVCEELKPLSTGGAGGGSGSLGSEDAENRSLPVQVCSLGRCWVLRRTYENFRFLDRQLHRCCYDRKVSRLPELPPEDNLQPGGDREAAVAGLLGEYVARLSEVAGSLITCGPVLNWLELDNRGHRLIVTDDSDINTPAVAAAYVVKRYMAQASDEISFETPQTAEEWKRVAQGFSKKWNFPNCIGAVDGKHILVRPPPDSGSFYYNYKGSHSIVLMAVSNADSNFIYVDVGTNGRVSDGGVWGNCSLNQRIEAGSAGMPDDEVLPNSSKILPYVIVADDAFPLKRHIMKPFSHQNQNLEQRVFSYRLSRARRTVENAFGILAKRFEVFHKAINLEPKKVEKIVLACTALHNYLRKAPITPTLCSDANIENADEILGMLPLEYEEHTTINGTIVRNLYMKYFNEEGTVIWQNRHT